MKLTPNTWPQDTLQIPNAAGRFMPPLDRHNFDVARQESFLLATTFTLEENTPAGTQFTNIVPTDQDGDFWCDQIFIVEHDARVFGGGGTFNPFPALIHIEDVRTARALTYPAGVPSIYFTSRARLEGTDLHAVPFPEGYRPTATLPQPFCFTRQGGIRVSYTLLFDTGDDPIEDLVRTVDLVFSGWKEYTYASRGQPVGGA